jgi:hypothetical protein
MDSVDRRAITKLKAIAGVFKEMMKSIHPEIGQVLEDSDSEDRSGAMNTIGKLAEHGR